MLSQYLNHTFQHQFPVPDNRLMYNTDIFCYEFAPGNFVADFWSSQTFVWDSIHKRRGARSSLTSTYLSFAQKFSVGEVDRVLR